MATNTDNTAWNATYDNSRVPALDTNGAKGAPFSLFSNDPDWTNGSINKAVKDTHEANSGTFDPADLSDITNGIADIFTLNKYVKIEMLYGQSGTSRLTIPGDTMSFRAYPTPIIITRIDTIDGNLTSYTPDLATGAPVRPAGAWVELAYAQQWFYVQPELKFYLPYESVLEYTHNDGLNPSVIYEFRIPEGVKIPNAYRLQGNSTWITLPDNKLYFATELTHWMGLLPRMVYILMLSM